MRTQEKHNSRIFVYDLNNFLLICNCRSSIHDALQHIWRSAGVRHNRTRWNDAIRLESRWKGISKCASIICWIICWIEMAMIVRIFAHLECDIKVHVHIWIGRATCSQLLLLLELTIRQSTACNVQYQIIYEPVISLVQYVRSLISVHNVVVVCSLFPFIPKSRKLMNDRLIGKLVILF